MALHGFGIDNIAAQNAIEGSKALHARRWQTKESTYCLKRHALPDVRDAPLDYFFFYCIAELAIKPCRSSRSNLRGEF